MAEWDTAYINDLPDSAFGCVEDGEKDEDGRTTPRSKRHFPIRNSAGEYDADHVRNALARLSQSEFGDCARSKVGAAAKALDIGEPAASERGLAEVVTTEMPLGELEVRSIDQRELGALIAPWDMVVDTPIGLESFRRGSFAHVDPKKVVLRLGHEGPPVGKGISLEERSDGAYMAFRVSKTPRGDEALTLASDGVTPHVSIEYDPHDSKGVTVYRDNQRTTELTRVGLKAVATTYKPYYERASVTYVRDKNEGELIVPEGSESTATATPPSVDFSPITAQIATMSTSFDAKVDELTKKLEERERTNIVIPSKEPEKPVLQMGDWLSAVLRLKSGEHLSDTQLRDLDDLITTDNIGVVPPTYSSELIGVIQRIRPFLASTRQLATPASGTDLKMPKLVTRPETGVQAEEKDELASSITEIEVATFPMITIGGAGDISLQLLKRSSPEFLGLYLELLAESLAANAEIEAIATLLADPDINDNGGAHTALDPENLSLGVAWSNAFDAIIAPPTTLWMNSDAIAAFIDAKATTTNQPLYSSITANATAGGGVTGSVSGLTVVHVPALNGSGVDVIAGPSRGFAWAEDGSYTLQVDVPAKAGRDVALVSMYFFAPLYPAAFTTFTV